jgi:PAS domain-containing protein
MGQPRRLETADARDLVELASAIGRVGEHVEGMRERMRSLEAVVENFPGGISVFDRDLNMVLCNDQQRRLLDYPDNLFAGAFPSMEALFRFNVQRGEYGPGEAEEHVARRMALVRQNKSHVYERTRPNGTVVEVRGVPITGGGFVTTYFDVTEQRRKTDTTVNSSNPICPPQGAHSISACNIDPLRSVS